MIKSQPSEDETFFWRKNPKFISQDLDNAGRCHVIVLRSDSPPSEALQTNSYAALN